MRKKTLLLLIAASMGASLVFAPATMAAKKKITWWTYNETAWQMAAAKFEKENPNVDVQIVHGELDKFYTMITAGLMPDVWGPWSTPGIHADVNRNWALDLSPFIRRDSREIDIDDFFPGVMRQFKINGKQYSLPIFAFADYFFYNTQLYAQAGLQPPPLNAKDKNWNWDQMVANALKTTVRDGSGRIKQGGLNFSTGTTCFPNYFHMWKAEPYSDEAINSSVPQAVHWNSPEMINCLTKMWELKWKHNVVGGDFAGGKTASSIEVGWSIQAYAKTAKLKWAIAPLPYAKTNAGTLWPDGWRISRISKDKELAWKFVKFLCSPDVMTMIVSDPKSSKLGSPAVRKSVYKETMGRVIGKATGMEPADVFKVHEQADDVGIVKYEDTICLHADLAGYVDPQLEKIWQNKVDPKTGAQMAQAAADKALPILFKRWIANIKFTGAEKGKK